MKSTRALAHLDILNLAVGLELPGLDAIVVIDRIDAANFAQLGLARLHVASVIERARLQQQRLAVPIVFEIKPHAGLVEHRTIDARLAPVLPAIERDVDAPDLAAAGPGET